MPDHQFPQRARLGFARRAALAGILLARLCVGGAEAEGPEGIAAEMMGKPVIARNADGRFEVFKVDEDGQLRHRWQKESGSDWLSWSSLGGSVWPGVAVTTNADGQLVALAVGRESGALEFIRQTEPGGQDWSGWRRLGGPLRAPVSVAADSDGSLEAFAVSARDNGVRHLWQSGPHGDWSEWQDLGGEVQPGVAVAQNLDGRLELFGVAAQNGNLVHCWQRQAGNPAEWSPWVSLGGCVLPGLAIGRDVRGLLEVFAVNATNGAVERICQAAAGKSDGWGDWQNFGEQVRAGLGVGQSADGRLEIIGVRASDGMLMHRWENHVDGADEWSVWKEMENRTQPFPAIVQNEDGELEVFVNEPDGHTVLHRRQFSHANGWLDWSSLDRAMVEYSARTWQSDEGLPDNVVQALAQTRDGYLWVGTREGLARFDGFAFTTLDNPDLERSSITALCVDRPGTLWIGTDGGGLLRRQNGAFTHLGRSNGLAGDSVRVVYEARDGAIWIGTTTGLSRWHNRKFTNYTTKNGLLSDVVTSLLEDNQGNLWIATGSGLNCLTGTNMDAFAMPNGLPNDSVRGICEDKGGRIWIGSNNGMLWHNNYWTRSFYAYNTKYGLSDSFVSAILEDRQGNLWVGTYSGLNRFRDGRFFNQLNNEGGAFDKVNALFEDRENNIWVGSKEGLIRLSPKRFFTYTRRLGLAHNNVMSVREDRNGSMWLGTWGGGLQQFKDGRFIASAAANGFSNALVTATCEGRDGALWVGLDFDGGLLRLNGAKSIHYTSKDGLITAAVRVIHEDRKGRIWIGTSRGLSCLSKGKFKNFSAKDGMGGGVVRDICEDHEGNLWFGTDGGLSRWNETKFTTYKTADGLSDDAIIALYEDQQHDLWIGTGSGGLNRFRNGEFTAYTTEDGMYSDEILAILEDEEGWLWMSSSKGVFRVRKGDLDLFEQGASEVIPSIAYGKSDGMESTHCNGYAKPAAWKSRNGHLWFATSKGLVSVDPAVMKVNSLPPPVYVEQVLADKRELKTRVAEGEAEMMEIAPGRGELEFHYTAISMQAPEAIHFKYKLDGVDQEWSDAGTRRVAYYNHVSPGRYQFQVIACNKDGVWNEAGASQGIVVKPHFWQMASLQGLAVVVVLGLAGGIGRYVTTRRMQRGMELLEQRHAIEKERGRIAKDIHDDIGSSLTRIMMLGERAEEGLGKSENVSPHLSKIVASARSTVQSLDEIVWAVNPENDSLRGLVEYISYYADEFFDATPIRCRLEMPLDGAPVSLPAELRHDLFLLVKEAFHNVLKHARASEVHVQVTQTERLLEVVISDDGCGFESDKVNSSRQGNGLRNMRKRIESVGGHVIVDSGPGKGTKITVTVTLGKGVGK